MWMLIVIFLLAVISGTIALAIFFEMIQRGGALDVAFNWQLMLDRLYGKGQTGNKWATFAESVLGGCRRCTSFWFMPVWFCFYAVTSKYAFYVWVTDNIHLSNPGIQWVVCSMVNICWYCMFHAIGAQLGFELLKKLSKK